MLLYFSSYNCFVSFSSCIAFVFLRSLQQIGNCQLSTLVK